MKYIGLDGREYKVNFAKRLDVSSNPSGLHLKARELLKSKFPFHTIIEEMPISGCKNKLFFDFVIPELRVCIEIQGQHHFKQVGFFQNKQDFLKQKMRDKLKVEWCELNEFRLLYFNFNEDISEWAGKLNG